MRLTASSMRAIETWPESTAAASVDSNCSKFDGCMNMSTPALTLLTTRDANVPVFGSMWSIPL
jgi:hypothetical protein